MGMSAVQGHYHTNGCNSGGQPDKVYTLDYNVVV